jgi:hypothetical protein
LHVVNILIPAKAGISFFGVNYFICSFCLDAKRTKKSNQSKEIAKAPFVFEISRLKLRFAIPFLHSLFLQIDDSDFIGIWDFLFYRLFAYGKLPFIDIILIIVHGLALGIEVLLKLFLCCCTYATQESDYRMPDLLR